MLDFPDRGDQKEPGDNFIGYLNFCLQHITPDAEDSAIWKRLAPIGVGPGVTYDIGALSDDERADVTAGVAAGKQAMSGATQLMIDNRIDRYLLNAPMLPDMAKGADGSLTLDLQHGSPGEDLEANCPRHRTGCSTSRWGRGPGRPVSAGGVASHDTGGVGFTPPPRRQQTPSSSTPRDFTMEVWSRWLHR